MFSTHMDYIVVADNRIRTKFSKKKLRELAHDIAKNGLYHAPVFRPLEDGRLQLVAGERRLRALRFLHESKIPFTYDTVEFHNGYIPYVNIKNLSEFDSLEVELHENLIRDDLDWKDVVLARNKLHEMRLKTAEESDTAWGAVDTAEELAELTGISLAGAQRAVADAALIAPYLASDVKLLKNVKSISEAKKIVLRQMEGDLLYALEETAKKKSAQVNSERTEGAPGQTEEVREGTERGTAEDTKSKSRISLDPSRIRIHNVPVLLEGDFRKLHEDKEIPTDYFDLIIADPPYGIDADTFGSAGNIIHDYADTAETALSLATDIFSFGHEWTKEKANLFMFCDVTLYSKLAEIATQYNWKVFRTPIIWVRKNRGHIPWGTGYFQRNYDMLLFASKGNKHLNQVYSDVIEVSYEQSDSGHGARKPTLLYEKLIKMTCIPDDKVIDPTCGSGTIFGAAPKTFTECWGVEVDKEIYKSALFSKNWVFSQLRVDQISKLEEELNKE